MNVMEADWDNLIILDACRYDTFEQECQLDGDLKRVLSAGGSSWEFMKENFDEKQHHDTVYVTGNAHISKLDNKTFHSILSVDIENANERDTIYPGPLPDKSGAILPEAVNEQALTAHKEFPQKRHIIHYMQPHLPFLGKYGRTLYRRVLDSSVKDEFVRDSRWGLSVDIFRAVKHPKINVDDNDIKKAYKENLTIVLDFVDNLLKKLDGCSVITSDHGQLLGERILTKKRYGHPHDIHPIKLIEVPWFECKYEERRQIEEDAPPDSEPMNNDKIMENLCELGYVD